MPNVGEKSWIENAVIWKATPKDLREPKTAKELHESLGVPEATFYFELAKPEIQRRILAKALLQIKDGTPDVLGKLKENALEGKERSIEMYLKYVLEIAEKVDVGVTDKTKDELKSIVDNLNVQSKGKGDS